jgi:hypothetical protein
MSALPSQVQQQSEAADRIEAELLAASGQPSYAEQEPQQDPEPQQVAPQSEIAQAPQEAPAADDPNSESWQKRYVTLQGMFNAEVPRLNGRIKDLETQLQSAVDQFREARTQQEKPEKVEPLITDKDEQAFGSDLLDVVKRQAQEVIRAERSQFQQVIEELRTENVKLNQQLGNVSERQGANDRRAYLATLEQTVPGFEQINVDPKFLEWLAERDPMSGLSRKAYLEDAFTAFDTERTSAIFNSWPGARAYQQSKPSPRADLAKQVAPTVTRAATTPSAPNDRVWSMTEIDTFYRDVSRGVFQGRDADVQRIEAEIDLAVSQGRVKP